MREGITEAARGRDHRLTDSYEGIELPGLH